MHRQKRSLSTNDQKAIDVLLDHCNSHSTRHAAGVSARSLKSATKLLDLLGTMPVSDPPADLVGRTMQRIDRDIAAHAGTRHEQAIVSTASLH